MEGVLLFALLALAGTVVLGVAVELAVFRRLRSASPLSALVASLGVLLTAQATLALVLGNGDSRLVPSALPEGLVTVFGTRIPADRFWLTGIVVLVAAALWALYRWSAFGLATRAASESEASAMLAGLPTDRLAAGNAALAAAVAGGMGILAASITVCMVLSPAGIAGSWRRGRRTSAPEALGQVELQRAT